MNTFVIAGLKAVVIGDTFPFERAVEFQFFFQPPFVTFNYKGFYLVKIYGSKILRSP